MGAANAFEKRRRMMEVENSMMILEVQCCAGWTGMIWMNVSKSERFMYFSRHSFHPSRAMLPPNFTITHPASYKIIKLQ